MPWQDQDWTAAGGSDDGLLGLLTSEEKDKAAVDAGGTNQGRLEIGSDENGGDFINTTQESANMKIKKQYKNELVKSCGVNGGSEGEAGCSGSYLPMLSSLLFRDLSKKAGSIDIDSGSVIEGRNTPVSDDVNDYLMEDEGGEVVTFENAVVDESSIVLAGGDKLVEEDVMEDLVSNTGSFPSMPNTNMAAASVGDQAGMMMMMTDEEDCGDEVVSNYFEEMEGQDVIYVTALIVALIMMGLKFAAAPHSFIVGACSFAKIPMAILTFSSRLFLIKRSRCGTGGRKKHVKAKRDKSRPDFGKGLAMFFKRHRFQVFMIAISICPARSSAEDLWSSFVKGTGPDDSGSFSGRNHGNKAAAATSINVHITQDNASTNHHIGTSTATGPFNDKAALSGTDLIAVAQPPKSLRVHDTSKSFNDKDGIYDYENNDLLSNRRLRPGHKNMARTLKAVSLQQDGHQPHLRHNDFLARQERHLAGVFTQCTSPSKQTGVLPDLLDICTDVQGAIDSIDDVVTDIVTTVAGGGSEEIGRIMEAVFTPLQNTLTNLVDGIGISVGLCLDNMNSDVMKDNAIDPCNSMPLAEDTEWSLFGFNLEIGYNAAKNPFIYGPPLYGPPGLAGTGLCPLTAGLIPPLPPLPLSQYKTPLSGPDLVLGACVAISLCDGLPSIAFIVKGQTLACLTEKFATATGGMGILITKAASLGLDSVSAGFSLTNAFEVEITFYNGRDLFFFKVNPTVYAQIKLAFNSTKINLPEYFTLSFTAILGIGIQAPTNGTPPTKEEVDKSLEKFGAVDGDDDLLNAFSSWTVQAVIEGELEGALNLESIPVIGALIPNFELNLGEMNAFLSTGEQVITTYDKRTMPRTSITETVFAGISVFAGTSAVSAFIKTVFNAIIGFAGAMLDALNWIGIDVSADDISKNLDLTAFNNPTTDDAIGVGFTCNTNRTGILMNVPLLIPALGQLKINCYTDYKQFDCDVQASAADSLKQFFTSTVENLKEGVLIAFRETNKFFTETGKLIAVGLQEFASDVKDAFKPENLAKTAKRIKEGAIEGAADALNALGIGKEELEAVLAVTRFLYAAAEDLVAKVAAAVQTISKFATALVKGAQELYNEAKKVFEEAEKALEDTLNCAAGSILNYLEPGSGGDPSCELFNEIEDSLRNLGNDIEQVFEQVIGGVTDFFEDTWDWVTRASYRYKPTGVKDQKTGCFIDDIYKVRNLIVSSYEYKVGKQPNQACVKVRIKDSADLEDCFEKLQAKKKILNDQKQKNRDAERGVKFTLSLEDFHCTSRWKRSGADLTDGKNNVPLEVTCETQPILEDGTLGPTFVQTNSLMIDRDDVEAVATGAAQLIENTKDALANKITISMTKEPVSCKKTPGPPNDGIDNDCNGVIDDDTLCSFDDRIHPDNNEYDKDCKCSPPVLQEVTIADVQVSCSADISTHALGYPAVEFPTGGVDGCPNSGKFLISNDIPEVGKDPAKNCGEGVILRAHKYTDDLTQTSNTVVQTIQLTKAPPELDETLLEGVVYVNSSVYVNVTGGFLAPDAEVPPGLGSSKCASELTQAYEDLNLEYVGCPDNPVNEASGKFKGANVERRWFVRDECGQEVDYTQNVVREDEENPEFVEFPRVRVQSCQASFDPNNTGLPVASDNFTPDEIINGRITHVDTGDTTGCPIDNVREFLVQDEVCNELSATQTIQSFAFEFESDTNDYYDPSSRLPTFTYQITGNNRRQIFTDNVVFIDQNMDKTQTDNCLELDVEYLNVTRTEAVWTPIIKDLSNSVFKFQNGNEKLFSIQLADERLVEFKRIVDESGGVGVFRVSLMCSREGQEDAKTKQGQGNASKQKQGQGQGNASKPRDLNGWIAINLAITDINDLFN